MKRRSFSPTLLVAGALFFPLLGADGGCGGSSDVTGPTASDAGADAAPRPPPGDGGMMMPPPPGDGGMMPPPPGDGGMMPPPPGDGGMMPPRGDGGMMPPPPGDGGMMPPPGDGGMMPPPGDGGMMMPPPGDGGMMMPPPGDGGAPPPGDGGMLPPPGDGGMTGARACTSASECTGACPPGSVGCTCSTTPMGSLCVPTCTTNADCPPRPGTTLVCRMGICAP